jgi:hypothetical protein
MSTKAVVSLTTGLEDGERVTVAFLVAVGAACDGCPALPDLVRRYAGADGRYYVCPICFDARRLDKGDLVASAELAGTVPMWEWIGDEGATTFSY